jgi:hypothetical protein
MAPKAPHHARFKRCSEQHGLKLHRIHVLSAGSAGSFQSTLVFDCACGLRWLLRVGHGDVVSVERAVLDELRRGREGQVTAPPGFPGAAEGRGQKALEHAARPRRSRDAPRVRESASSR